MNFQEFLNNIHLLQNKPLGGLKSQLKLAPAIRLQYSPDKIKAKKPKKAAVLALFYPDKKGKTRFLLTLRASYKGTHSAQISFPGGKVEVTDTNLKETALREAFEEVSILKESVSIVRKITDIYIPPSNFLVTPFIGYAKNRPKFIPNSEVATLIEVLVEDLINNNNISTIHKNTSYMQNIEVPCFKLNNYFVWGATAMMLNEIKELIKQ